MSLNGGAEINGDKQGSTSLCGPRSTTGHIEMACGRWQMLRQGQQLMMLAVAAPVCPSLRSSMMASLMLVLRLI